ncbi:TIGR01777 family oxidoreductase [Flavobacterium okayamense]|uniref:Epimerase n=1 Tax=Flavobacterium okayamense TaxID=2830782 RepID=A0ABN6HWV0_9FLAO|nr:TIGR01777 family oxidoreductase [Flavobacterium okayamense]BCY28265.1 epimerase [Flavobacterium okayamense]
MKKNKIIIVAGTGFLGNVLINYFENSCDTIIILTRRKTESKNNIKYVQWNAKTLTGWEKELENADVLINLAGKSVDCRYTEKNKAEILASRIDSTKILNAAILQCENPPKHFINSSTATIYRHSEDKEMTERNGEIGNDFSMNVAKEWEKTFFEINTPKTNKTALRTSIVLGKNGGAFIPLKRLAEFGLGGKQGNGNQFISWIHELDFARAIDFVIDKELVGKVNIVSPKPIRNKDFMFELRKSIRSPFGLSTPTILLKIGAKIIGTEPELVLKSRNVIPEILLENGFQFEYSTIEKTFKSLLK